MAASGPTLGICPDTDLLASLGQKEIYVCHRYYGKNFGFDDPAKKFSGISIHSQVDLFLGNVLEDPQMLTDFKELTE